MEDLRYPIKRIGDQDDYFKMSIVEYKAPGLGFQGEGFALGTTEQSLQKSKAIATIILPMPANIQDNNAASWTEGTMNPVQAALGSAGYSGVLSNNLFGSIGQSITEGFSKIDAAIQSGQGQKATAGIAAGAALQAALGQGDISGIVSRVSGQAFNQNVELLFQGVALRPAFSFSWDMVPRSKEESDRIRNIIRTLKVNMTAKKGPQTEKGGGLFISAPNVFKLQYMSGRNPHPFLHLFKPCALTQMSVNYNGSGQYSTYADATPVHMQVTLQFQELSPIYQEDYVNDQTKQFKLSGVGY